MERILKLLKKHKKFVKFCIVGAINTLIDMSALVFFVEICHWQLLIANSMSFSLGVLNSFLFNKFWTFRNKENKNINQFIKFFIVSLFGLFISNILLYLLVLYGLWYLLAKILVVAVVVFWNYFINKFWTFRII